MLIGGGLFCKFCRGESGDLCVVEDELYVALKADEADIIDLPDSEEGNGETIETNGLRLS